MHANTECATRISSQWRRAGPFPPRMFPIIIPNRSYLCGPFSARSPSLLPHGISGKSSSQLNRFLSAGPLSPGQQPPRTHRHAHGWTALRRHREVVSLSATSVRDVRSLPPQPAVSWQLAEDDKDSRQMLTIVFFFLLIVFETSTSLFQLQIGETVLRSDQGIHFFHALRALCAKPAGDLPLRAGSQLIIIRRLT